MFRSVLLAVVLLLASSVAQKREPNEKFVKVLSDKNFDKHVKKGTTWMIEFYAPWCGHCKSLQPVWAEAARRVALGESGTKLAKVDATANPALTRRFSIQGYPTIKLVKDGKNRGDYTGGRTEDDIVKFAAQAGGSAMITLEEDDGLWGFANTQDISFVLTGVEDGDLIKAFEAVAEEETVLGSVAFGVMKSVSVVNEFLSDEALEVKVEGPSLVVVNTGEASAVTDLNAGVIEKFVKENKTPFFPELSPSKNWAETKKGLKSVLVFVDQSKDNNSQEFLDMMRELKKEMKDDLVFGWVDAPSHTYLLDPIGLSLGALPAFVVVDIPEMTFYKAPFATEKSEIKTYLQSVVAGKQKALPINEDKGDKKEAPAASEKKKETGGSGGAQVSGDLVKRVEELERLTESLSERFNKMSLFVGGACLLTILLVVMGMMMGGKPAENREKKETQEEQSRGKKKRS